MDIARFDRLGLLAQDLDLDDPIDEELPTVLALAVALQALAPGERLERLLCKLSDGRMIIVKRQDDGWLAQWL